MKRRRESALERSFSDECYSQLTGLITGRPGSDRRSFDRHFRVSNTNRITAARRSARQSQVDL